MKKILFAAALALTVLCGGPFLDVAEAQRRGFSGGRSFSGRSSRPSFSRPSGGRSYSSGSRPSSRPSFTPRSSSPSPRPSSPGFSRPGSKSYSSGSKTTPRPPARTSPGPFGPFTRPSTPSGKSYSPGRPGGTLATPSRPTPNRPAGDPFDAGAGAAQRRVESKRAYTQGKQPKPTYTDPQGKPRPIDPRDRKIEELRRDLGRERWVNRERRQREQFGPYYTYPVATYRDPFGNLFWWWLLAQSLDTRANWAYHHRHEMDESRYREMLRRDAKLEERVRELEAKGVKRDPTFTPKGVEPDLMYTDEYVDSVYNPQPSDNRTAPYARSPAAPRAPPISLAKFIYGGLCFLFQALLVLAFLAFLVWLVFFKRWGGS